MKRIRPYHRWLLFAVYTVALGAACLAPAVLIAPFTPDINGFDLAAHFLLFGGHAALFLVALGPATCRTAGAGAPLASVSLTAAYGIAIECLQAALRGAGRHFDWWDLAADAAGATVFSGAALVLFYRLAPDSSNTIPSKVTLT